MDDAMNRRHFIALSTLAATAARSRADQATAPLLSFGLLTDVQYADADPQGERHFRESIPKLQQAAADLSKESLPFSLHLGDTIDREFGSFATILPHFKGLGHPVYHLMGNHEFSITDESKSKVVSTLGMPADYYSFTANSVRFIMLDTNDLSTYKYPKGSEQEHASIEAKEKISAATNKKLAASNGGFSAKQLDWLKNELAHAQETKEPVILCGHHPLLPEGGHQAWNANELLALIESHNCVRAYFNGHNHAGAEAVFHDVPCITFKSILHEPGTTAYSTIHLFNDRLQIVGRGREKSRIIPLRA
jgi:3',5'-cyclic AMP phosphodiesterase CpdA